MATTLSLILASGSPRRRDLLGAAGFDFDVVTSNAEESASADCDPAALAKHNASVKAISVAQDADKTAVVIGADTIVVLDGTVFGKPADEAEAQSFLRELSGKTHQVITGVCLVCGDAYLAFHETTDVTFKQLALSKQLEAETIAAYVATGEPLDKAGAYGIQGLGAALVDHIDGDFDNVVGLPMTKLTAKLAALGFEPHAD